MKIDFKFSIRTKIKGHLIIIKFTFEKMINVDFSDLSDYRIDGRKNDELR